MEKRESRKMEGGKGRVFLVKYKKRLQNEEDSVWTIPHGEVAPLG